MRWATLALSTLSVFATLAACSPGDGATTGIVFGPDGGAVITGDTVSTPKCSTTPGCGPSAVNTYVDDPALFDAVLEDLVTKGCSRFFSDCNYLCSQIFYDCGANMTQCVQQSVKRYGDDYDHPVINAALAVTCGQEILAAPCSEVPPDTRACNNALLEGCPTDSGDLAGAYSWTAAAEAGPAPALMSVALCEGADKWAHLSLEKGQVVALQATTEEPTFATVWIELHLASETGDEPLHLRSRTLGWSDQDATEFGPVDIDGDYLFRFSLNGSPSAELGVRIDVTEAP
jgi:hypothetical protein